MKQVKTMDHISNLLTAIGIMILVLYTYTTCARYQSPGNGILKKRVVERRAEQKMGVLLDSMQTKDMHAALERMQGIATLLDELHAKTVDEALEIVRTLKHERTTLLSVLDARDIDQAVNRAQQVKLVVEQLNQLQTKLIATN